MEGNARLGLAEADARVNDPPEIYSRRATTPVHAWLGLCTSGSLAHSRVHFFVWSSAVMPQICSNVEGCDTESMIGWADAPER